MQIRLTKGTHVDISVTKWCIIGSLSDALWDLWDGSTLMLGYWVLVESNLQLILWCYINCWHGESFWRKHKISAFSRRWDGTGTWNVCSQETRINWSHIVNNTSANESTQWTTGRADSRFSSSQWETALLCNDVSHLLGASLESALTCIIHGNLNI